MKTLNPPLKRDETFLGNTESNIPRDELKHIKGLRFVRPAYDLDGNKLNDHWAMIADPAASAEYNRVMEASLSAIRRGMK